VYLKRFNILLVTVYCAGNNERHRLARLTLSDNCHGMGATQLHGIIYVLCFKSHMILTYDSDTLRQLEDFELKELTKAQAPEDITACSTGNFLYVYDHGTDATDYCIWQIKVDQSNAIGLGSATRWLTADKLGAISRRLSATSNGRLLTLRVDILSVDIYGQDAKLERRVILPGAMTDPRYVVEDSLGNFVIAHTRLNSSADGVSKVDKNGENIQSYNDQHSGRQTRIRNTLSVAIDSEDHVYVCDYGNQRVLVLDLQLRACYVLPPGDDEKGEQPHTLYFVKDANRLLVGSFKYVDIFA